VFAMYYYVVMFVRLSLTIKGYLLTYLLTYVIRTPYYLSYHVIHIVSYIRLKSPT